MSKDATVFFNRFKRSTLNLIIGMYLGKSFIGYMQNICFSVLPSFFNTFISHNQPH